MNGPPSGVGSAGWTVGENKRTSPHIIEAVAQTVAAAQTTTAAVAAVVAVTVTVAVAVVCAGVPIPLIPPLQWIVANQVLALFVGEEHVVTRPAL